MVQHAQQEKRRDVLQRKADLEVKLEAVRQRERKVRERQDTRQPFSKKRKTESEPQEDEESQFVLDDYQSDEENATNTGKEELGLSKDCLLYTSPSPRDGLLSRMPSSA